MAVSRPDGRIAAQLRPLASESGALARADGSARFSQDQTEVIVAIYGPCEAKRSKEQINGAVLEVVVRPRAGLPSPSDRQLEQQISHTLQHAIIVTMHPRTAISVVVQVISEDGALLSAALNGTCVALMHAGVPLRGMLGACTIAVMSDGAQFLDPSAAEESEAHAVLTLAYLVSQSPDGKAERQLLLSSMRGTVTSLQYDACQHSAREAAACTVAFFRQALARSVSPLLAHAAW